MQAKPHSTKSKDLSAPIKRAKENGRRGGKKREEEKTRARKGKEREENEKPPGKRQRQRTETEKRAREGDVFYLYSSQPEDPSRETDWWHEAHCKAVPEKKRQCTIKGAGNPLLGKLDHNQPQWKLYT